MYSLSLFLKLVNFVVEMLLYVYCCFRLLSSTLSRFVPGNSGTYTNSFQSTFLHTIEKEEPVFGEKYELSRSDINLQGIDYTVR